jgi:3-oxoacyl-[acyl-carrier protein] reductase
MNAVNEGLLNDKLVVVTASAGAGIGLATAKRALEEGATVVVSDTHDGRLMATREQLLQIGPNVHAVRCDVTSQSDVDSLFETTEAHYGPIDVFINNAGLGGSSDLVDISDDQWLRVLDVSLTGTFRCTRAAMTRMCPRGEGVIVNVSSVTAWRAEAGQAHYAAAKAGVLALTRSAAMEAAPHGVRINAIAPTLAMHPFIEKVANPDVLAHWISVQPQKRPAEPREIADVIVFLASDLSSYMTGEVVSVGGQRA